MKEMKDERETEKKKKKKKTENNKYVTQALVKG